MPRYVFVESLNKFAHTTIWVQCRLEGGHFVKVFLILVFLVSFETILIIWACFVFICIEL